MNIFNQPLFKRVYQKITGNYYNVSYSQTGEDLLIEFLIHAKQIKKFNYLDIGANHPVKLNNTYKFYETGYRGICIEPDPGLFKILSAKRKGDVCLNVGIAGKASGYTDFYIMSNPLLNTFSQEEAKNLEKEHHCKIDKIVQIPLLTVEDIIRDHFSGQTPVFINLDAEGLDEEILTNFPFHKYRPSIFCVETVHFTIDASSEKRQEIMNLMKTNNYVSFADTYVNTIFIDAMPQL